MNQTGAQLRLELFVKDIDSFLDFYRRVLGFEIADDRRESAAPYASVVRGSVRLGAVPAWEPVDPSTRYLPSGVEIVIEVEDVSAEFEHVQATGWPLVEGLQARAWGLTDFRLLDPDGYFLRITSAAP